MAVPKPGRGRRSPGRASFDRSSARRPPVARRTRRRRREGVRRLVEERAHCALRCVEPARLDVGGAHQADVSTTRTTLARSFWRLLPSPSRRANATASAASSREQRRREVAFPCPAPARHAGQHVEVRVARTANLGKAVVGGASTPPRDRHEQEAEEELEPQKLTGSPSCRAWSLRASTGARCGTDGATVATALAILHPVDGCVRARSMASPGSAGVRSTNACVAEQAGSSRATPDDAHRRPREQPLPDHRRSMGWAGTYAAAVARPSHPTAAADVEDAGDERLECGRPRDGEAIGVLGGESTCEQS